MRCNLHLKSHVIYTKNTKRNFHSKYTNIALPLYRHRHNFCTITGRVRRHNRFSIKPESTFRGPTGRSQDFIYTCPFVVSCRSGCGSGAVSIKYTRLYTSLCKDHFNPSGDCVHLKRDDEAFDNLTVTACVIHE